MDMLEGLKPSSIPRNPPLMLCKLADKAFIKPGLIFLSPSWTACN